MRRRLLLALAAFALACVSIVLMAAYVRGADARAVAGREPVRVYVAAKRVPAGTTAARLRDDGDIELVVMPAATVPENALQSIDENLAPLVLTAPIERGQLLLRGMFDRASTVSGGLTVPDGMLAMSVPVKLEGAVANYVTAGADVTVFFSDIGAGGGGGESPAPSGEWTRVLLERVRVLAVGVRPESTGGSTSRGLDLNSADQTILLTLSVRQEDAQRLVLATGTGTLYAALLSPRTTVTPGAGADTDHMYG
ncbi:Flp pilus assembly protein CpaB [Dactylosporangium sp. CS-047395]|uniref:Flp pilus assembly protein CpaB n=1 Tax=Dactylosporangium sp. CS-047395 TaxID=3239936 RepID=UPI003D943805